MKVRDADHIALSTTYGGVPYVIGERLRLLPGNEVHLVIQYMGDGEFLAGRGLASVETNVDLAIISLLNLGTAHTEALSVRALPSGFCTAQLQINGIDVNELEVMSVEPSEVSLVVQGPTVGGSRRPFWLRERVLGQERPAQAVQKRRRDPGLKL